MWIYWAFFMLFATLALTRMRPVNVREREPLHRIEGLFYWSIIVLFVGWRHEVGGDWFAYKDMVNDTIDYPIRYSFLVDPAYNLLNWIGGNIGGGIYFVNMICAVAFSIGLLAFCKSLPRPELALLVSIPYLVIVVSMGYTRQATGIGLGMLALVMLKNGSPIRFFTIAVLAACFHKTAILYLGFSFFYKYHKKYFMYFGLLIVSFALFAVLLQQHLENLIVSYLIVHETSSSGTNIRYFMNALPALLFLLFRKKFAISSAQKRLWTWLSVMVLLLIIPLIISPTATAIDRIMLYFIPLQLFVFSHLPCVLGKQNRRNAQWVYLIVFYNALVLFTWGNFADNNQNWLPYKFYPFVWAFQ